LQNQEPIIISFMSKALGSANIPVQIRGHQMKQWLCVAMMACAFWASADDADDYRLKVNVVEQGHVFQTQASFYLPLNLCQAYRYITDYDAATHIPGVVESRTTRLDVRKVEVTELPDQGTDFVQISGEAKSYKGSWRLEPDATGTLFKYSAESEPDKFFPKAVIEYFIKNRLSSSFDAMAKAGATRKKQSC
jgi:hypothetical protein